MSSILRILPVFILGFGLSMGCKDDSPDNVGACEDYLEATKCGDVDPMISCDSFKNTTCDISDYFDCLADNLTCEDMNGTKVLTPSADYASCAAKASCS